MRARPRLVLATVLLAATARGEPPASVWNRGTAPPPATAAAAPPAPAALPLRVYEGLGAVGPLYAPPDDTAYAIDVVAEFASCPDGSRIVTALQIAGQRYPLTNRCAGGTAPATGTPADGTPGVARCDARRWTCRSGGDR
jgi:hypothetical protein